MESEGDLFAILRRAPRLDGGGQVARLSLLAAFSIGTVMFSGAVYGQARLASISSPGFVAVVVTMWTVWLSFTVYWAWSAWRFSRMSGDYFAYHKDWQARNAGFDPRVAEAERARRRADGPLRESLPGVRQSSGISSLRSASGDSAGVQTQAAWRDAEDRAARWLRRIDGGVVQGRGRRDGGIDVESSRHVVQVKDWNSRVGAPAVREIAGVASAKNKRAVVISRSGFTAEATRFASDAGVALFQDIDGRILPVNAVAETMRSTWK